MGDENLICTLGDYSKPSHEGYRNTIELPVKNNVVPLRSDSIRGPYDTQYCIEDPEQAFVEYASSRTDEAGGKWYTFKPEQNNLGDTYNPSWRIHPNLRLSKFEADFKRQQGEMTNKIDIVLKAITDQIASTLPSDTVKNPKLGTHPVSSARSYPTIDPQCSTQIHGSINAITIHPKQQSDSFLKFNSLFESLRLVPSSPNVKLICTKEEDGDVMFIEIIPKDDNSRKEEPKVEGKEIMRRKLDPRKNANGGVSNFTGRIEEMHVFVKNFTYIVDFMIVKDISLIIDPRLSHIVLRKPFIEIEQYNSLSNLDKEHTKSVYLRNEEDKRRGVEYVMSKILGFYKECLELGPEYLRGMDDNGEVM
nr:protein kinase-like domain, concanavalin A-like lectin/glucanase domain protein [Tanacetum cinerariifolium]